MASLFDPAVTSVGRASRRIHVQERSILLLSAILWVWGWAEIWELAPYIPMYLQRATIGQQFVGVVGLTGMATFGVFGALTASTSVTLCEDTWRVSRFFGLRRRSYSADEMVGWTHRARRGTAPAVVVVRFSDGRRVQFTAAATGFDMLLTHLSTVRRFG